MNDVPPVNVNVTPAEPAMTITLKEVYEGVNKRLDELGQKFDSTVSPLAGLPADVAELKSKVHNLEMTTVRNASVRWWFSAVAGLIVAATTVLALFIHT